MSLSFGATLFPTLPPISILPSEISSSPAIIRRSVLLPQPEGPTSTQNSPSAIDTSTPCTTGVLPNDLRTALRLTAAIQVSVSRVQAPLQCPRGSRSRSLHPPA